MTNKDANYAETLKMAEELFGTFDYEQLPFSTSVVTIKDCVAFAADMAILYHRERTREDIKPLKEKISHEMAVAANSDNYSQLKLMSEILQELIDITKKK